VETEVAVVVDVAASVTVVDAVVDVVAVRPEAVVVTAVAVEADVVEVTAEAEVASAAVEVAVEETEEAVEVSVVAAAVTEEAVVAVEEVPEVVIEEEEEAEEVPEVDVEVPEEEPRLLSSSTDTRESSLPRAKKMSSSPKTWFLASPSTERRELLSITMKERPNTVYGIPSVLRLLLPSSVVSETSGSPQEARSSTSVLPLEQPYLTFLTLLAQLVSSTPSSFLPVPDVI